MTYLTNPLLDQAFDYVQNTHQNIFLTGKAGTGKTTFLHKIKKESLKQMAIVAPTGIAAINAKGVTIHSLFQIPFGPYVPGIKQEINRQRKFTKKKIHLIKNLDLLIIDEISMVRADLIDAIDDVLRRYKNRNKPFGGIQLLMIGDLYQLSPVTTDADWKLLKDFYASPYFFDSNAWKSTNPITIQLTYIYRQSDSTFIDLLNRVRDNHLDPTTLQQLNSRYIPDFKAPKSAGYITLTALNRTAQALNQQALSALSSPCHEFRAKVKGIFPEKSFPTEEVLEFKIGAQVLFIKNDVEKRFYNGKIGQISAITKDIIYVKCPNETKEICVTPLEWKHMQYSVDQASGIIREEEKGLFIQYPLKLAWAITIHKSQGLTFEKAIIDAQNAFTHGQVYVALSRCKNFDGIVLRTPISYGSVRTDTLVKNYSAAAEQNQPDETHLQTAKHKYQVALIGELFSCRTIRIALNEVIDLYLNYSTKLTEEALKKVLAWESKVNDLLFAMTTKFQPILANYFKVETLPEANQLLQRRLQKAGLYFTQKIKQELLADLRTIPVFTDNQDLKEVVITALKNLERTLFIKYRCFLEVRKNAFSVQQYLQTKTIAKSEFEQAYQKNKEQTSLVIPSTVKYPTLYKNLFYWRNAKANELKRSLVDVISTKSMTEMAIHAPTTQKKMLAIKGFGRVKFKTFGKELFALIDDFCYTHKVFPAEDKNISSNADLKNEGIINSNNTADNLPTIKNYSVQKILQTAPKAYQPWTTIEEKELVQLRAEEHSISYIAEVLVRKRGAITSRLKKLDIEQLK